MPFRTRENGTAGSPGRARLETFSPSPLPSLGGRKQCSTEEQYRQAACRARKPLPRGLGDSRANGRTILSSVSRYEPDRAGRRASRCPGTHENWRQQGGCRSEARGRHRPCPFVRRAMLRTDDDRDTEQTEATTGPLTGQRRMAGWRPGDLRYRVAGAAGRGAHGLLPPGSPHDAGRPDGRVEDGVDAARHPLRAWPQALSFGRSRAGRTRGSHARTSTSR